MPDPIFVTSDPGAPVVSRVKGARRVIRPGAPGADPAPQGSAEGVLAAEDSDASWGAVAADSNDARLKQDVPPHWG